MGVMLIAPEFLTTFTTKKMLGTKKNVTKLKELAGGIKWDLPQTILTDMGGIIVIFSDIGDQDNNNERSVSERPPQNPPNDEIPPCPIKKLIGLAKMLIDHLKKHSNRRIASSLSRFKEIPMSSSQNSRNGRTGG